MPTNLPIASFLMPVYNGAAYLAEAIESVLGQTERNIELVAVDDGSTDSSLAILRRFAGQDARVRVFAQEHRGLVASLNRGLEVARGSYICRLDADDIAMPDRVEKQVRFLEMHQDYVLIGGQVTLIGDTGKQIGIREQPVDSRDVEAALQSTNCFVHSSVMFRRAEIVNAGGYDSLFFLAEDYELWIRLVGNYRMGNLPDVVCRYRIHGKQVSSASIFRQIFMVLSIGTIYRGASRAKVRESMTTDERDFVQVLRTLGLREDEIAERMTAVCLYWVSRLRSIYAFDAAFALLLDSADRLREWKCGSEYLFQVYSLGILCSIDGRRYSRAVRFLLQAFATSPRETGRHVLNKLLTLSSNGPSARQVS